MKFLCYACLVLAALLCTQAWAQTTNAPRPGQVYWYLPQHEVYAPVDLYKQPAFQGTPGHVTEAQQVEIMAIRDDWYLVRFQQTKLHAFIHGSIFRARMYRPGADAGDAQEAFDRASIFEEDPELIQRRLAKPADVPAGKATRLKPWQRYKEHWGDLRPEQPAKKTYIKPLPKTPANTAAQPRTLSPETLPAEAAEK